MMRDLLLILAAAAVLAWIFFTVEDRIEIARHRVLDCRILIEIGRAHV